MKKLVLLAGALGAAATMLRRRRAATAGSGAKPADVWRSATD
jgi:hypothetical protein